MYWSGERKGKNDVGSRGSFGREGKLKGGTAVKNRKIRRTQC